MYCIFFVAGLGVYTMNDNTPIYIMFHVYMNYINGESIIGKNHLNVFDIALLNSGNEYRQISCVSIAPLSGIHSFVWTIPID